jgi:hypothetical protein
MSLEQIIKDLEEERNRIDRALQALIGVRSGTFTKRAQTKAISPATRSKIVGKRRTLSPAARRKIAAAQRARWANIKAKK